MRTEEAPQTKVGIKESVWRIVRGARTSILLSMLSIPLFMIVAIQTVPLGPRFIGSVITAWTLAVLLSALAAILLNRGAPKEIKQSVRWPFTKKQTVMVAITGLLLVPALSLAGFVEREIKEAVNADGAEAARQRFIFESHLGSGPEFDVRAVNQTLADLEDSYQRLKHNWPLPKETDKIYVQLFRDLQSYHDQTGNSNAAGHFRCTEYSPVISIPLEDSPSASSADTFSRTPIHEMVHALMCQSLGRGAYISVPPWFHEGIAMRYHTEGLVRTKMRVETRLGTWLKRDELMNEAKFCRGGPDMGDRKEQALFYSSALELVRSLEARNGMETINLVVEDVRKGGEFEGSIRSRLGGTCKELYGKWKGSF